MHDTGERSISVIALVALVAVASRGLADVPVPVPRTQPLILHVEGTMAGDRAAAARAGFAVLSLAIAGANPAQRYWIGVEEVHALADYPRLGKDILDDLHMYDPMLFAVGPPDLVERFAHIAPATRVVLEGLTNGAARTFYLRSIITREPGGGELRS